MVNKISMKIKNKQKKIKTNIMNNLNMINISKKNTTKLNELAVKQFLIEKKKIFYNFR